MNIKSFEPLSSGPYPDNRNHRKSFGYPEYGKPLLCRFDGTELECTHELDGFYTRRGYLILNADGIPAQPDRWWWIGDVESRIRF